VPFGLPGREPLEERDFGFGWDRVGDPLRAFRNEILRRIGGEADRIFQRTGRTEGEGRVSFRVRVDPVRELLEDPLWRDVPAVQAGRVRSATAIAIAFGVRAEVRRDAESGLLVVILRESEGTA